MKECRYCGSIYEDSLSSCPNCGGSKIVTAEEKVAEEKLYIKEIQNQENSVSVPADAKKNKSGFALVLGILAIAVVICIAIFGGNGTSSSGQTKAESNAAYEQGVAYYNSGDYENAIMQLSAVAENSKHYDEAQEMLATASANYSADIISKANTYVEKQEYEVALTLLENALSVLPEDVKLQNALNSTFSAYTELVRTNAIAEADAFAADGDFESAIMITNDALSTIGADAELSAKLEAYTTTYVENIIESASSAYKPYDAEAIYASISIVEQGLNILPENISLQNEYSRYLELQPISVAELIGTSIWRCEYPWGILQDISDTTGKVYKNTLYATCMSGSSLFPYDQYVFIDLDFQYTRITGSFYANPKYQSADAESELYISVTSAQESLSAPTYIINSESSSIIDFEIDLTGAKQVYINLSGDCAEYGDPYHYAYIGDLLLWK